MLTSSLIFDHHLGFRCAVAVDMPAVLLALRRPPSPGNMNASLSIHPMDPLATSLLIYLASKSLLAVVK
jgi:hypothetical protein